MAIEYSDLSKWHYDSPASLRKTQSGEGYGLKSLRENCSDALYQGPTSVGPLRPSKNLGFSPCAFLQDAP